MSSLNNKKIDAAEGAESLVRLLVDAGERVPPRLRERILSFGTAVVPPLIVVLTDPELADRDAPGEGWAPIHAAQLLGELRAVEAAEPMVRLLVETDWELILHDELLQSLPKLGPAVLEPALAAHTASETEEPRNSLCHVLARLGVRDERIFKALAAELQRDIVLGSGDLSDYGDPRALPLLLEALDRLDPVADAFMATYGLADLLLSIEQFGGQLTPEQQAKADRISRMRSPRPDRITSMVDAAVGRMDLATSPVSGARALPTEGRPAPAVRKVGRNDPCPCGSGKKFKRCCLGKEG